MARYLDIVVKPDFSGLPPNVYSGLVHLTDNAAAVLMLASGLGIVISLVGLLFGAWTQNPQLSERMKGSLLLSVCAIAFLYVGVALANYAARLFA
jgi:hypothetical protein